MTVWASDFRIFDGFVQVGLVRFLGFPTATLW